MPFRIRRSITLGLAGINMAALGVTQAAATAQETAQVMDQEARSSTGDVRVVDAEVTSRGYPFSLTRFYHWDPAAAPGLLGKGWKLTLEARIDVSTETVVLHDADGTKVTFTKQSDGTYSAPAGTPYKLSATTDGYRLTPNNEGPVRNFDQAGRLTTVVNRSGDGLHLAYASNGRIASVSDAEGRVVRFTTSNTGLLLRVTLADGGRITYVYTNGGYLAQVADVLGRVLSYTYDSQGRLITR
ncbi:hypothetical protein JQK87_28270 [Streptomyces sp. G44]|uniref:DUF6531 domain-containing protein n=1 Tax=Streptomyces sp. G44 TaxID=2807632 RepID=UPI00195F99D3|nr:DUF6531 domain-containing protein [Streptomyces sp. G44]MBM7172223.1 hypothetical protein [Streptomyces sp. G44]